MVQSFEMNAFSDGQVGSKLWACQELERVVESLALRDCVLWILAGWTGVMAFLLLSRERLRINQVRLFDLDRSACETADLVNKYWELDGQRFKALVCDCASPALWSAHQPHPTIVINTACEHFLDHHWFDLIPEGTIVVLQSTDQPHDEPVVLSQSPEDLAARFSSLKEIFYLGEKRFVYPTREFRRFMVIGRK